jgi:hypothetical protein
VEIARERRQPMWLVVICTFAAALAGVFAWKLYERFRGPAHLRVFKPKFEIKHVVQRPAEVMFGFRFEGWPPDARVWVTAENLPASIPHRDDPQIFPYGSSYTMDSNGGLQPDTSSPVPLTPGWWGTRVLHGTPEPGQAPVIFTARTPEYPKPPAYQVKVEADVALWYRP